MTKFASLKKIHAKIIIIKRNPELYNLGFICCLAKLCPDLPGFTQTYFPILSIFLMKKP